jgi:hypothetical protein
MHLQLRTPVVLIIFKRPDTTQQVFEVIRQTQPKKLLVIADGPRSDREGEAEKCAQARAVINQVDWDCEVLTNYSEVNLGCGKRVSTGLDWVFEQVEEAIILEDDCVPHLTFFHFCEELLEQYRLDCRVFSISAQHLARDCDVNNYSYYFSRYQHSWGWATWRRAWKYFDFDMKHWPTVKEQKLLETILQNDRAENTWRNIFQKTYIKKIDTWDYQWMLTCWLQSGLSIHPKVNLVTNIGFGLDATHTSQGSEFAKLELEGIQFPLIHPPFILQDIQADKSIQANVFDTGFIERIVWKIKGLREKITAHLINH